MKFNFTPSKHAISFNEYLRYKNLKPEQSKFSLILSIIPGIALLYLIFSGMLSINYRTWNAYLIIIIGVILEVAIGIGIFILILNASRKKVRNKKYIDINSEFEISLDDSFISVENCYIKIKLKVNSIVEIDLLKNGLVIIGERKDAEIFIPNSVLPVKLDEFIGIFKKENEAIEILDFKREMNKRTKMILGLASLAIILSIPSGFLLGKYKNEYNFKTHDLIMQEQLEIKELNNTYIYRNDKLNITIYFPKRWEGNYGIEELEDRINLYYLVNGEQSFRTTLICTIGDKDEIEDIDKYNIIKYIVDDYNDKVYSISTPKYISTLKSDEPYYKEYTDMHNDLRKLIIETNNK